MGVGFGGGEQAGALALAAGIGIQNLPEGLVVAIALRDISYTPLYALGISTLTGLVEPIGGFIGAGVVSIAQPLLPWGMGFAAGAMLFVIVDDIIPEIDQKAFGQRGHPRRDGRVCDHDVFGYCAGIIPILQDKATNV